MSKQLKCNDRSYIIDFLSIDKLYDFIFRQQEALIAVCEPIAPTVLSVVMVGTNNLL